MSRNIELVSARAGLTNYYHNQVIRNPSMDMDSTIIDQLSNENINGGVSGSSLLRASIHSSGLKAQPDDFANIRGGWNESKGLMKLDFVTQQTPVNVEYMHVIGYIADNSSMEGIEENATFIPVMSWKSHESIQSTLDISIPTKIHQKVGGRCDYLLNDGSQTEDIVSMRPSDIIDFGVNTATQQDIENRSMEEGLGDTFIPVSTPITASIKRTGVVGSKRANINPVNYSMDILKAGTSYQTGNQISTQMDSVGNEGEMTGTFSALSTISYEASNNEPSMFRDEFFQTMREHFGSRSLQGFTGYAIRDLMEVFPNINDVLDLTLMDASQFQVNDFTQNSEAMGTSRLEEYISQEITMTIMDLLMNCGLSAISFSGSNCDNFGGDTALSNVVILPYNPASLKDDDFELSSKVQQFIDRLTNQIFAKLNGLRAHELTPIRFNVTSELFGTTVINMMTVNETNLSDGFDPTSPNSINSGMQTRSFPTFAVNNFSPIVGSGSSAQQAGANFYSNLQDYFQY